MSELATPVAGSIVDAADFQAARAGDDAAFTRVVAPLRRELRAHCYRMLGSIHDADDALQDALVRAWRGFGRVTSPTSVRAWLYTVATRTCLDAVAGRKRRALPVDVGPASDGAGPLPDIAWLGPYPSDALGISTVPGARYEQREAIELAFVAALQHLPGNQRAALLLVEVLGFSAAEIATMMDTSVASVTSALQRARRIVATKVPPASQQHTLRRLDDARLQHIVNSYCDALERGDADALVALLTEDVTWSMPPLPQWYEGRRAVTDFAVQVPLSACGRWRHLVTSANGQPAVASYLCADTDADDYAGWSIDVLTLRGDRIAEITAFIGAAHFTAFGLPGALVGHAAQEQTG